MDILPNEMISEILKFVNFKFRIVCKNWKANIEKLCYYKIVKRRIKLAKILSKNDEKIIQKRDLIQKHLENAMSSDYGKVQFNLRYDGDIIIVINSINILKCYQRDDRVKIDYYFKELTNEILSMIENGHKKEIKNKYKYEIKNFFFAKKYVQNRLKELIKEKIPESYWIENTKNQYVITITNGKNTYFIDYNRKLNQVEIYKKCYWYDSIKIYGDDVSIKFEEIKKLFS